MKGPLSSAHGMQLWGASAAALLSLSLVLTTAALDPALADKVGVAAAVNPDAFSSLAGTPKTQLNIGKSIFFNERINTTGSGLVQVLLVDGSTFTVGPGSDLVIDKFVYNPSKGTGEITASFSKGVMRFVGGKISKNEDAVTIKTPAGAMAIRGCIVLGKVTSPSNFGFVLVYGDYLKMKNLTVFEPGNGIFSQNGKVVIGPAPKAFINEILAGLTNNGQAQTGGNAGGQPAFPGTKYTKVDTLSLQDLISDATANQINDKLAKEESNDAPPDTLPQGNTPPVDTSGDDPPPTTAAG